MEDRSTNDYDMIKTFTDGTQVSLCVTSCKSLLIWFITQLQTIVIVLEDETEEMIVEVESASVTPTVTTAANEKEVNKHFAHVYEWENTEACRNRLPLYSISPLPGHVNPF